MEYRKLIVIWVSIGAFLNSTILAKDLKHLDIVTVTAQKSEENIQKVPLSIDAFDEVKIEDFSISSLEDIGKYSPGLYFFNTGQPGLTSPTIRGVGANIVSYSSPVSLYVDGVPTMNSFGFSDGLEDIERIEILKGPQGTLYGKNSEAGVINVITKKPDNDFRGKVFTKIGTDGKRELGFNLSGPIIEDTFYAGIAYKHNEKDGFIKHATTGKYINDKETDYGKLTLRYTPTDNLDMTFIASRNENDNGAIDWAPSGQKLDDVSVSSNLEGYSKSTIETYAFSIDYDVNDTTTIQSITSKRIHKDKNALDNDLSALTLRHFFRDYKFDTLSQELRVEKELEDVKIVSGVYLDKEEDDLSLVRKTVLDPSGANSHPQRLTSKTYSFFTNIIYALNERFTLNGGIRYDKEKKDITVDASNIYYEKKWNNISPKLSLQYTINNSSMTYLTVAKGYRSGGFNPFAGTVNKETYDEESLISYEIGYKSMFSDNKLKFNTAVYYMDIDDMQIQTMPTPSIVYMVNAASATSKGIELDIEALLSDNVTLFSSFGYNKTTFDKFMDNGNDYSNNYNPNAPKYNYNLGLQYRADNGVYARTDINGYGKTYFDSANLYSQKAYNLVNLKLGYERDDYEIYLYGNNIFDKEHHANAYFNGTTTIYKEGREVGIKLAYRF